ncbi:MAG TPA: SRPBCC family protein [Acidimicrobiales bacterium]|nr:SRPBCC family protein [Acidimicrobiales bacterium]
MSPTVRVSVDISAPPATVWACVEDIETHTQWMQDAVAIRFTSSQRRGVGTTFDCDTRIGPFRLTDRMEVTDWRDGEAMAIRHVGLVTGEGRFDLVPIETGTRFVWTESLVFPRRQGGAMAARVAAPILRRVWRGNLLRLRELVEGGVSQR